MVDHLRLLVMFCFTFSIEDAIETKASNSFFGLFVSFGIYFLYDRPSPQTAKNA
jgi:hypothetical protein